MNYTSRYGDFLLRLFPIVFILLYISACAVKPASDLDSPEYHHKAGMRHVEMGQYNEALTSFNRATDLDKKFAPAYAGMGIAYANLADKKKAAEELAKNLEMGKVSAVQKVLEDTSTTESRAAFAKSQRDQRVQKYMDLMGYDRSKKTAIADALIDASKIVSDRGTLEKKNITRDLINPIIQATSKRFDKPEQIREAVGLMSVKAAITKDLEDPSIKALRMKQLEKLTGGFEKDLGELLLSTKGTKVTKGTLEKFTQSLIQVSQHLSEWSVEDEVQTTRIDCLKDEIRSLSNWCNDQINLMKPYPWNGIYQYVEDRFSLECQEMVVSLIIEPHGPLVDDLAETMSSVSTPKLVADMPLSQLKGIVEDYYVWATTIDFTLTESQHHFWYYSEDKLEPRFGSRDVDEGSEQEMPLAIGRDAHELNHALLSASDEMLVGEFVLSFPQFRHIIRRIQNTLQRPYSEVQDNLLDESMRPLDLLRFKLAFFGASKFDPKSDLWTRISMYQGAPMPDQLSDSDHDKWFFPVIPKQVI